MSEDPQQRNEPGETPEAGAASASSDAPKTSEARIAPGSPDVIAEDAADKEEPSQRVSLWKKPRVAIVACLAVALICVAGITAAWASGSFTTPSDELLQTTEPTSAQVQQDADDGDKPEQPAEDEQRAEKDQEDAPAGGETDEEATSSDEGVSTQDLASESTSGSGEAGSASAPSSAPSPAPAPEPEPSPEPAPAPAPATITVSVYVDSSRAAQSGYPACLASTSVTLNQGASVYDALVATGVSVGGSGSYVRSINGLAEFSLGSGSGWLYFVNGSYINVGPNACTLNGGESITWIYTLDNGSDV